MRKIILLRSLIASMLALSAVSCSQFYDRHVEYADVKPDNYPVLRALGYAPIALQSGDTEQHKMLQAMKASKLEAYRELTEMVYGQRIDASNKLGAMLLRDDELTVQVQGVIRGARVIKTYAVNGTYITELELDFKQVQHLYQNVQPRQTINRVRYF
ncbi:MAG: flagellar biosynthesis protein FlgP [Gammaproteobacteria bacterium]|nr:flagellar biosynthesis protein FlgP [Gammaproteobacteria bacterium]MBU2183401.1 flagellar biosynthesis protein FlgP [Gammaproteobacteria bacterium]MBU2204558.1 flagellar biosynthesis protein FlgP [Gammaproteobacteria bacterium]